MFALVAMNEDGMIPPVEDGNESRTNYVFGNVVERFFVSRNTELHELYVLGLTPFQVCFRIFFQYQSQDGLQSQGLHKFEVSFLREPAPIYSTTDQCKILWRNQILLNFR